MFVSLSVSGFFSDWYSGVSGRLPGAVLMYWRVPSMGGASSDDRSDGHLLCGSGAHSVLQVSLVAGQHLCRWREWTDVSFCLLQVELFESWFQTCRK